ncbi:MAG: hypothetical protein K8F92_06715 [Hyphomicrobium sp.]|uniref:hypothetical protein n=1 Tax=Hyphomicrobium sp. TaxID=82 RepID=UPI001324E1EE|nr:hypothetical protein [Hyphomicrobium sp.]KAB2944035.1 MAG: hypothetical protein F9K20_01000 [Hyphomicrobium sp.]MBZ0209327.1 hypothetical protein [Hyphomicrobium sp.]
MQSRKHRRSHGPAHHAKIAAAALAVVQWAASPAEAAPGGCAAVNRGALNADVAAGAPLTRRLGLEQGDLLSFTTRGVAVALVDGPGAPSTLIGGSAEMTASFKAPADTTYTFQFNASSGQAARVIVSCTSTRTEAANAAFLERRKALLNERDPDRLRIDRAPTPIANPDKPLSSTVAVDDDGRAKNVEFSVSLSEIAAATQGGKPEPGIVDFWLEGRMQNYAAGSLDTGSTDGNLGVLYLGTRSMLGPDIMVGALAQLDRGVESAAHDAPEMAARGWMVGPYMSMKLGSGVVFDSRASWGETENAVASPEIGDNFTERRLVRGKLTGTREVGGWKVAPSVGLVYVEDAVRDSASGETKAAGTGKVEVLPEVSKRFSVDDTTFIEPRAAVGAFVGFDGLQALNPAVPATGPTDVQLKAEAGVAVGVKDGSTLQATGGVESGTASTADTWSGRLQLNMPLGK